MCGNTEYSGTQIVKKQNKVPRYTNCGEPVESPGMTSYGEVQIVLLCRDSFVMSLHQSSVSQWGPYRPPGDVRKPVGSLETAERGQCVVVIGGQ